MSTGKVMYIYIKQHFGDIRGSLQLKVNQNWGWVEKRYNKACAQ